MSGVEGWPWMLGSLDPLEATKGFGKTGGMVASDLLLILGAGFVLTIVLLIWARSYVKRSKKRERRHRHRNRSDTGSGEVVGKPEVAGVGSSEHRHRRRRRPRRDHRGRNPTLAEAGGLPPVQGESTSPRVP
jgi:hypothetical protein